IEAGLSSEEDECAANGKDAEEIAEARAREVRRHRASGTVNPKELATAVELLARAGYKVDAGEIGQALGLTVEKAEPTGEVTGIEQAKPDRRQPHEAGRRDRDSGFYWRRLLGRGDHGEVGFVRD
ncbi:MAG TPA: hypothetical protein PK847_11915, partial [Candidatus Sumerlaeota bacterium]|nr:hypothetical protein [Candidatus Sumerlaeota bacterium]